MILIFSEKNKMISISSLQNKTFLIASEKNKKVEKIKCLHLASKKIILFDAKQKKINNSDFKTTPPWISIGQSINVYII